MAKIHETSSDPFNLALELIKYLHGGKDEKMMSTVTVSRPLCNEEAKIRETAHMFRHIENKRDAFIIPVL